MNLRPLLSLMLACLCIAGCRSDPSIDLLESELRSLEDELYLLDDELEQKCAQLASCRRENRTLRTETGSAAESLPSVVRERQQPAAAKRSEPDAFPVPDLSPPTIEPGIPSEPKIELPEPSEIPPPGLDEPGLPDLDVGAVEPAETTLRRVAEIGLDSRLTGGYDFDGKPGDEGLLVVIEPRDETGQYVPAPAAVVVVVLDKTKTGPAARVARWNFDSSETTSLLRKSLFGRGIHLQLPWPSEPPQHADLQVFARYVTADGRKLQADRDISVDVTPRVSAGWTPISRQRRPRRSSWETAPQLADKPDAQASPPTALPAAARPRILSPDPDRTWLVRPDNGAATADRETPGAPPTGTESDSDMENARNPVRQATRQRPIWRPFR